MYQCRVGSIGRLNGIYRQFISFKCGMCCLGTRTKFGRGGFEKEMTLLIFKNNNNNLLFNFFKNNLLMIIYINVLNLDKLLLLLRN